MATGFLFTRIPVTLNIKVCDTCRVTVYPDIAAEMILFAATVSHVIPALEQINYDQGCLMPCLVTVGVSQLEIPKQHRLGPLNKSFRVLGPENPRSWCLLSPAISLFVQQMAIFSLCCLTDFSRSAHPSWFLFLSLPHLLPINYILFGLAV